jgi:hypothetical protein
MNCVYPVQSSLRKTRQGSTEGQAGEGDALWQKEDDMILTVSLPRNTICIEIFPKLETYAALVREPKFEDQTCWRQLFHNAVVVRGYPTLSRTQTQRGLEVPLDLMAGLGNADYLTEFDGVPVLKGFSNMFVATAISARSIQWHFLCSRDGGRISYLEARKYRKLLQSNDSLSGPSIVTVTRHFVGWASSVRRLAGKLTSPPT